MLLFRIVQGIRKKIYYINSQIAVPTCIIVVSSSCEYLCNLPQIGCKIFSDKREIATYVVQINPDQHFCALLIPIFVTLPFRFSIISHNNKNFRLFKFKITLYIMQYLKQTPSIIRRTCINLLNQCYSFFTARFDPFIEVKKC